MDDKELWEEGRLSELVAKCIIDENLKTCEFLKDKLRRGELRYAKHPFGVFYYVKEED